MVRDIDRDAVFRQLRGLFAQPLLDLTEEGVRLAGEENIAEADVQAKRGEGFGGAAGNILQRLAAKSPCRRGQQS